MSKIENHTLMQWLVDFRQQETSDSLESISAHLGISRSTLNIYLSQKVSDKKIGRNYKSTLLKLLKLNLSDNDNALVKTLNKNNSELFNIAFKRDFDFLSINKIEDIEKLHPANDEKYKLIFVTDYFKASEFEVLEFANGTIEIEDNHNSRRKIHLNEYHDPKIVIHKKESEKRITITAIQFPELDVNKVENYLKEHSSLDGVYIGKADDGHIVSGKVRIIPEENYSNVVKLGTILNREGRTPFIGKGANDNMSSKYEGCYTNFYYKPKSNNEDDDYDSVGVNTYILLDGKVFGAAFRNGKLRYYVGSYYEYDERLWIESFHANDDFDIIFKENENQFALKSILKPVPFSQDKILTGDFLGYSAKDFSISGFEYFLLNKNITELKNALIKNDKNAIQLIQEELISKVQPTLIGLTQGDGLRQNFTLYKDYKFKLTEKEGVRFMAQTLNNEEKEIFPSVVLIGFDHFIERFFKHINAVLDA